MPAKRDIAELFSMPTQDRKQISWQQASEFVVPDTMELTSWSRLMEANFTPYEALLKLKGLQDSDFDFIPSASSSEKLAG